jgi:hypothetical protein
MRYQSRVSDFYPSRRYQEPVYDYYDEELTTNDEEDDEELERERKRQENIQKIRQKQKQKKDTDLKRELVARSLGIYKEPATPEHLNNLRNKRKELLNHDAYRKVEKFSLEQLLKK